MLLNNIVVYYFFSSHTCVMSMCLCVMLQMHLDSPEALGVLNTLFETVAPSSLRPVDMLLKSMFVTPSTMVRELLHYILSYLFVCMLEG